VLLFLSRPARPDLILNTPGRIGLPAEARPLHKVRLANLSRLRHLPSQSGRVRLTRLIATPGYDAEAAISPDGKRIVFTSIRDGDLELYTMNSDGTGMERTTCGATFANYPMFSPKGMKRVFALH